MEAVLHFVTSIQSLLQVLALCAAGYALYELLLDPDWRRRPGQTAARVWVVFLCGVVGVSGLILEQNAVLVLADRLAAPLHTVQAAFLGSLLIAVFAWARD